MGARSAVGSLLAFLLASAVAASTLVKPPKRLYRARYPPISGTEASLWQEDNYTPEWSRMSAPSFAPSLLENPADALLNLYPINVLLKLSPTNESLNDHIITALTRFEQIYGLTRYVGEITIQQVLVLIDMEPELELVRLNHSGYVVEIVRRRMHILGNLGYSLIMALSDQSPVTLFFNLTSCYDSLNGHYAKQAAIEMFVISCAQMKHFRGSKLKFYQEAYYFIIQNCTKLDVIHRFCTWVPAAAMLDYNAPLLFSVPFATYAEFKENLQVMTKVDIEALSGLGEYYPQSVDNSPAAREQNLMQTQILLKKLSLSESTLSKLDAISRIRYGTAKDIYTIPCHVLNAFFRPTSKGPSTISRNMMLFLWDRTDLVEIWFKLLVHKCDWWPQTMLAFSPAQFFKNMTKPETLCILTSLNDYGLHDFPETYTLNNFEYLLFSSAESLLSQLTSQINVRDFDCLIYALTYAQKKEMNDFVERVSAAVMSECLRSSSWLQHLLIVPSTSDIWKGPVGKAFISQNWLEINPSDAALYQSISAAILTDAITVCDREILELVKSRDNVLLLSELKSGIAASKFPLRALHTVFDCLGYNRHDLLFALTNISDEMFPQSLTSNIAQGHCGFFQSVYAELAARGF